MSGRPQYDSSVPHVWRRATRYNGVEIKPGDPVDMVGIPHRKIQDLYEIRRVERAPSVSLSRPMLRPTLPVGHELLDSLPIGEAEDILTAAMGDLSPLDWNACEQAERDDRVMVAIDLPERESSSEKVSEPSAEGKDIPEREVSGV